MYVLYLEKGRGTRDQIADICWIIEKERELQKNIYFCFIDYAKAFDCVDHNKLKNSSRDGNTRQPYLPPEKHVCKSGNNRITHWTDWFKIRKGECQGCILSPCLFNLHAEYIMQNARVDGWITSWNKDCQKKYQKHQICKWYNSNSRKQRGTKEPLDEGEKGEWKSLLKCNIQKTKIMVSNPITSWKIEGENVEAVTEFIFLGSKITANGDSSHKIKRPLLLRRKAMNNLDSVLKSRGYALLTKVCLVKVVVFSVVM